MVGPPGLEPGTNRLWADCSNHWAIGPTIFIQKHGGAKKLVLELFLQGIKIETVLALREIYENDYESQVCFPT